MHSDVDKLAVWEVNEARSYGLSSEQYVELIGKLKERHKSVIDTWSRAEIKKAVTAELRPILSAEMRPGMREDVTQEMTPKLTKKIEEELRAKLPAELKPKLLETLKVEVTKEANAAFTAEMREALKGEVREEIGRAGPTILQLKGAVEYLLDAEVECMACAEMASAEAGIVRIRQRRTTTVSRLLKVLSITALGPLCFFLFITFGLNPWALTLLVPLFVLFGYAWAITPKDRDRWGDRTVSPADVLDHNASEYLILADRARRLRLVEVPLCNTKTDILTTLQKFMASKEDMDKKYHEKEVAGLQKIRIEIRNRIVSEVDTLKIFDVADASRFDALDPAKRQTNASG